MSQVEDKMNSFYPHAQKQLGFNRPPSIVFDSDPENAKMILGKTAQYEPSTMTITVFVDSRHPKDILRSIAHELVHHTQNCRGEFDKPFSTKLGYAQEDGHMHEMEREAYEQGNLCFRAWEDGYKKQFGLQETIYTKLKLKGEKHMSIKDWKNSEINSMLMERWGYKAKTSEVQNLNEGDIQPAVNFVGGPGSVQLDNDDIEKLKQAEEDDDEVELNADPMSP